MLGFSFGCSLRSQKWLFFEKRLKAQMRSCTKWLLYHEAPLCLDFWPLPNLLCSSFRLSAESCNYFFDLSWSKLPIILKYRLDQGSMQATCMEYMEYGALTLLYSLYSSSVTLTSVPGGLNWEHQAHFNLQCQLDLDFLTLLKLYSNFYSATNLLHFKVNLKRGNKLLQSHEIIIFNF